MEFQSPFDPERQTGYSIVEQDTPGDLGIFFSRLNGSDPILIVRTGGKAVETSLETGQTFYVEPGQDIEFEVVVENRDAVVPENPDHCNSPAQPDGSGSILDAGIDTRIVTNGFADDVTKCLASDPAGKTQYVVTLSGRVPDVETGRVVFNSFWAEGANSGVRVTPKYSVQFVVNENADGIATETPTEGTGDPTDTNGFDLSTFTSECTIRPLGPNAAEVEVDVSGTLPTGAAEGSRELLVDLLLDGETVATQTAFATVNGSGGATFDVRELPAEDGVEKTYQVSYDIRDNGWA